MSFGLVGLDWQRDGADWPNLAMSRFVQAGGLTWHVQEFSASAHPPRPTLLLVHGTASSTHSWRALAPLLADRFHVVAMDLPSHAFTTAPPFRELSLTGMASHVAALLQALPFRPDVVVGHSAGAAILARLCLDSALSPQYFVSLNGALLPFDGMARHVFPALAKLIFTNPLTARMVARSATPTKVAKLLADMGSPIDPEGLKLYTRLFGTPRHVAGALGMMANWDLERIKTEYTRLTPKMLLVSGGRDRAIPPWQAEQVRARVSGSKILSLDNLGHLAHEEDPKAVAKIIKDFVSV